MAAKRVVIVDDNRRPTYKEDTVGDGREQVSAPIEESTMKVLYG